MRREKKNQCLNEIKSCLLFVLIKKQYKLISSNRKVIAVNKSRVQYTLCEDGIKLKQNNSNVDFVAVKFKFNQLLDFFFVHLQIHVC